MADKKLNELDQIRAPAPEALLYLLQGGVDYRIERQHLLALAGYVKGLGLEYLDDRSVTVSEGRATASTGDFLITLDAPVTVDLTAIGAGGLDSGTEAPDTWYAVHLIGDTTGANPAGALFSTSADSPTLPGGYDRSRRIGWVRNDSAGDLIPFWQRGSGRRRICYYNTESQDTRILHQGQNTTWTTVEGAAFLPPTCREAYMAVCFARLTGEPTHRLYLRPPGSSAELPLWMFQHPTGSWPGITRMCWIPTGGAQSLQYRVDSTESRAFLDVAGFGDSL
ncbi:MAG: hypothetical protein ACLFWL_09065 [Candidatus Brocadiia bacterium]